VRIEGATGVDMKRVKARKDAVVAASAGNVEKWMRGLENVRVYQGHARFVDERSVKVNDEVLTAPQIFVDVGGRPLVPKMPGSMPCPTSRTSRTSPTRPSQADVRP
jgi:pyruvate/2-oxoglutarate dehydrogenase complex dihydrolipoamide dehydrogenase (E3) component